MKPVVFRPAAEADLLAIAAYIAEHDPARARKLVARLRERCNRLSDRPHLGRPRPELGEDVRGLWEKPYLMLYRVTESEVEILTIIHGARDLPAAVAARLGKDG